MREGAYGDHSSQTIVENVENEVTFARRYLTSFLAGYDQENTLDRKWLEQLPLFLELRQVILYSSLYRNGNLASLDRWSRNFLERARRNMENSLPIIDMKKVILTTDV
ncbi:hypothetical protein G4V62_16360 [Bacillaceae bacterium SIJ1]|uniref:hypothetical protein n=1 Tax=Litoribacterium kuwaitense TaxID=1398745 RepID=UPI0013EB874E|nr:hypothetical protein [Litoribacterium kuwaitense]NGP46443.1 hypothetical protein [Litoribacterium kuwaitense]